MNVIKQYIEEGPQDVFIAKLLVVLAGTSIALSIPIIYSHLISKFKECYRMSVNSSEGAISKCFHNKYMELISTEIKMKSKCSELKDELKKKRCIDAIEHRIDKFKKKAREYEDAFFASKKDLCRNVYKSNPNEDDFKCIISAIKERIVYLQKVSGECRDVKCKKDLSEKINRLKNIHLKHYIEQYKSYKEQEDYSENGDFYDDKKWNNIQKKEAHMGKKHYEYMRTNKRHYEE